jgi:hypothetical protein
LPPPAYQVGFEGSNLWWIRDIQEVINDSAASPYPKLEPNNFSAIPHQSPYPNQSIDRNAAPITSNYGNNVGGAPSNTVVYVTRQFSFFIDIRALTIKWRVFLGFFLGSSKVYRWGIFHSAQSNAHISRCNLFVGNSGQF